MHKRLGSLIPDFKIIPIWRNSFRGYNKNRNMGQLYCKVYIYEKNILELQKQKQKSFFLIGSVKKVYDFSQKDLRKYWNWSWDNLIWLDHVGISWFFWSVWSRLSLEPVSHTDVIYIWQNGNVADHKIVLASALRFVTNLLT